MNCTNPISKVSTAPEFVHGVSPSIQTVNSLVADIASTNIPVLLLGESGTGKDAYAQLIHRLSGSSSKSFKKVDCATLDAQSCKGQVLEMIQSDGKNGEDSCGTLFLDQIDELDMQCQRALLPLLPDGETSGGETRLEARLISSASRGLEREVEEGRFRRELYFRISGVSLRLPALRERMEDIPTLLERFLIEYSTQLGKPCPDINNKNLKTLLSHAWPGNIRELQNVAKMMVVLGRVHFAPGELRSPPVNGLSEQGAAKVFSLKIAARAASHHTERELILKTLERTRWNRKRAAQELQISYKSLLYKLKRIEIRGSESGEEI